MKWCNTASHSGIEPFYPPRARWYGGFFDLGHRLARRLRWRETLPVTGCSWPQLLAVLILPAYGFFAAGCAVIGRRGLLGYGLAGLVAVIWPGQAVANLAVGLLISLHAVGAVFGFDRFRRWSFRQRIKLTLAVLLAVGGLYWAMGDWVTTRWVLPLRVHDRVVLIRSRTPAAAVKRGDWIAYRLKAQYSGDHAYIAGGYGFGRVQGLAGDRIRFAGDNFWVNDRQLTALARMPRDGEWVVPEKQWFVWAEWAIAERGVSSATVADALSQVAFVSERSFLGTPYQRWFGRQLTLPTSP